jgi:hypothetical protein
MLLFLLLSMMESRRPQGAPRGVDYEPPPTGREQGEVWLIDPDSAVRNQQSERLSAQSEKSWPIESGGPARLLQQWRSSVWSERGDLADRLEERREAPAA